jgi:antitoxin PrlF
MAADLTTVTAKGQITIPKAIREAVGIAEGDHLLLVVEENHVLLIPMPQRPLRELFGALPATRPYPGTEAIRREFHEELGQRVAQGDE